MRSRVGTPFRKPSPALPLKAPGFPFASHQATACDDDPPEARPMISVPPAGHQHGTAQSGPASPFLKSVPILFERCIEVLRGAACLSVEVLVQRAGRPRRQTTPDRLALSWQGIGGGVS